MVQDLYFSAVRAVNPGVAVRHYTDGIRALYKKQNCTRLIAVGFGKASCTMALAVEEMLGDLLDDGVVITPYGQALPGLKRCRVFEAAHPLPDDNGVHGTRELVSLIAGATAETMIIMLVSGGGSALLVSPVDGILLKEKHVLTRELLRAGADIAAVNTVRKHLSRVKGGRLAELAFPAPTVALILSDVIDDRLDVIASGPTAPDPTTYAAACEILNRYGLLTTVPQSVVTTLEAGRAGLLRETPKPGDPLFYTVTNLIIGNNRSALEAAGRQAQRFGMTAEILSTTLAGEARDVGRRLARTALNRRLKKRRDAPHCLLSGGETTVTVTGDGVGGRNMELALAFAQEIEGISGITLLSAGTDGIDGPTEAAGAVVDGSTVSIARNRGMDPDTYLHHNNTFAFFREAGGLFVTGPTGTNVMDLQIIVIE